jgi:SAM-dependent methyltransferase
VEPHEIDVERPSAARVYDYLLGGAHNFAADRQVAENVLAIAPEARQAVQANRAFLRRAVEFLVGAGIRQFLDVGSGIPTVGHVHEIAQGLAPESRVVFVDVDAVAVAHSRAILKGNARTAVVHEDVRRPERILNSPEVTGLLDLEEPVAVLVVALLHFVSDEDDPRGVVARLTGPLAPGSYLALSHITDDGTPDIPETRATYRQSGIDMHSRSRDQVEALFAGFELVEPGLVWVPQWHPESAIDVQYDNPASSAIYAGVGYKR